MTIPVYKGLDAVNPQDFKVLLNQSRIRKHLIEHRRFDNRSIKRWLTEKIAVDALPRCKVRVVYADNELAGWCGIQRENDKYEIAIVLGDKFWGMGKDVFNDVMGWARELGHDEIFIHLLHTRPDYRFLRKIAINVFETEMFGDKFTTYQLPVN